MRNEDNLARRLAELEELEEAGMRDVIVGEVVEAGESDEYGCPVVVLRVDRESARAAGALLYQRAALTLRMVEAPAALDAEVVG